MAEPDRSEADVAVVGAGISGLVAAVRLADVGFSTVVLEDRDRVGGRLLTHQFAAGHLDLGATWFWPGEPRVAALIAELGIRTHHQHLAGDAMYHVPNGAQRIDGNPIDVASGRFSDGAASLTAALAERLGDRVLLRSGVRQVNKLGSDLTVGHAGGSVSARHVVLALAPSVAVQRITFDPDLPPRLRALALATPVWMGTMAKVVAVFDEPFWRHDGLAGAAISHVGPLRELHDMSGPDGTPAALFGFAPLARGAAPPTRKEAVAQLVEIFGPAAAHPTEVVIEDWRVDADATAPGATPVGTYGHRLYQEPAGDGRVHWASTETAPISPGHIEGAIAAAERAVAAIISDLARTAAPTPAPNAVPGRRT